MERRGSYVVLALLTAASARLRCSSASSPAGVAHERDELIVTERPALAHGVEDHRVRLRCCPWLETWPWIACLRKTDPHTGDLILQRQRHRAAASGQPDVRLG